MTTKLKDVLHHYLGSRVKAYMVDHKIDYVNKEVDLIIGMHQYHKNEEDWCVLTEGGSKPSPNKIKPYLYSLERLTKEITHEGETFVPAKKLTSLIGAMYPDKYGGWGPELSLEDWVQLIKWRFNVFNLSEDEFIAVTEENNPYV